MIGDDTDECGEWNKYAKNYLLLLKADAERAVSDCADGSCVVYFIQESGMGAIKIGVTGNIESRMAMLRVNSPHESALLGSVPGDERLESYLHDLFHEEKIRGEWFRPVPAIFEILQLLKKGDGLLSDIEKKSLDEIISSGMGALRERPSRKRTRRLPATSVPAGFGLISDALAQRGKGS